MGDFASIYHHFLEGGRVPVFDGAIGTMLQRYPELKAVHFGEELNLSHPKLVQEIHRAYFEAGADFITTNTFSANRLRLSKAGLGERVEEINIRAVELARAATEGKSYVAGSIGPIGSLMTPLGSLTFSEAEKAFMEQAQALQRGGADLIIIETMAHPREIKAAIAAVRNKTTLPLIASMTFSAQGRTIYGTSPKTATNLLESLGVDVIGANCSVGPWELLKVAEVYHRSTKLPILIEPNAGQPRLVHGRTVYDVGPDEFAQAMNKMLELGIDIIGSCCGSDPSYTRKLRELAMGFTPQERSWSHLPQISSRTKGVSLEEALQHWDDVPEIVVRGGIHELRAASQGEAPLIVLNLRGMKAGEMEEFERAFLQAQILTDKPFGFRVANAIILERCLQATEGIPLVILEPEDKGELQEMERLVNRYGGVIVKIQAGFT